MAFFRLHNPIIVLLLLALSADGNATNRPTLSSETKPLKGSLLSKLTSFTTRTTQPTISQPVVTTEFKRGRYTFCNFRYRIIKLS